MVMVNINSLVMVMDNSLTTLVLKLKRKCTKNNYNYKNFFIGSTI